MLRKLLTTLLLTGLCHLSPFAQQLSHEQGVLLVQIPHQVDIRQWVDQYQQFNDLPTSLKVEQPIVAALNIWKLSFDHNQINEVQFLEALRLDLRCLAAQFNHFVTTRQTIPDDPFFDSQWQHINTGIGSAVPDADMDSEQAWNISTGGLTLDGDTIVVAVLDDGVNTAHPDLGHNLWINHNEIPDNGLDDDNNGYIDDHLGWNIATNSDQISGGSHGMPVAGIIGARGNNGIGVAGINWQIKLMIVKNDFNTTEAAVLAAYAYPLAMRQLYNNSGGAQGAFVVATNASWGINFGQPDNAPLWCAIYDELGANGILNCGATANLNIDVDVSGDLPTTCPSEYLIAVTNLKKNDEKETLAAYGPTHVDLGAYGSDVFTLTANNYGSFGGTSGATPQVTGAVALLYSTPCPDLMDLINTDPAAATLQIKDYILEGADPNASLDGITVSGGKLNLYNSVQLALDDCSPCSPPYNLQATDISLTQATLSWNSLPDADTNNLRWRPEGSSSWTVVDNPNNPYTFSVLDTCQTYEFQVESICTGNSSGFSNSSFFTTDGCCIAPANVWATDITFNGATINFEGLTAAFSYNIKITNLIDNNGLLLNTTSTSLSYNQLESCTPYEAEVEALCWSGETTDFSPPITFTTFGCGACTDFTYCPSNAETADFEWIAQVSFNAIDNVSGSDEGFGDFTGLATEVATYGTYPISLTPGFSGAVYEEYFKVWIDYNQDGQFDEDTELTFDAIEPSSEMVTGEVVIPGDALPGLTRMRVSMKWISGNDPEEPAPCLVDFGFGEVEDYCVLIEEGVAPNCDVPINLDTLENNIFGTSITWEDPTDDHSNHNIRYRKTNTFVWTQFDGVDPPFQLVDVEFCTEYEVQVEANCTGGGTSGFSPSFVFKTACSLSEQTPLTTDLQLTVFPNPFGKQCSVSFSLAKNGVIDLSLTGVDGRSFELFQNRHLASGHHQILLDPMPGIAPGVYWLCLRSEEKVICTKVVNH